MSTPGILFYTAAGLGHFQPGVPLEVQERILDAVNALDQVLPGACEAAECSRLKVVYDPKNRQRMFVSGSEPQACYFWPAHTMYLGDSGIRRSIVHEWVHMLDILAGPTLEQNLAKFGLQENSSYSVYHFWPQGGRFTKENQAEARAVSRANFERWFLLHIIGNALIARQQPEKGQIAVEGLLGSSVTDAGRNDFLQERVANLAEEFVFTWQVDHRLPRLGVSNRRYFENPQRKPLFWGSDWIREKEAIIRGYFGGMLGAIQARCDDGTLQAKVEELRTTLNMLGPAAELWGGPGV